MLNGDNDACLAAAEQAGELVRQVNFVPVAALADATSAMALLTIGDGETALPIARAAVPLAEDTRWESSVRTIDAVALARAGRHDDARAAVAEIIDIALDHCVPFVLSDAVIALAAIEAAAGDRVRAAEVIDLAGVGRTPLTIALMYDVAAEIEFDLGFERFAESLDGEAVDRRGRRAAEFLRTVRPSLD